MASEGHLLRIGELSRRAGVGVETLRAWERRYGLLRPQRTQGNFRLYGPDDEARVRAMVELRARGLAAAEAARLARDLPHSREQAGSGAPTAGSVAAGDPAATIAEIAPPAAGAGKQGPAPARIPAERVEQLVAALLDFDEPAAHAIVDRSLAELSAPAVLDGLLLPAARRIGRCWEEGSATVGEEHFASGLLRSRMLGLARGWGVGWGPRALLACPPGEQHDLGLLAFGIALREQGWRIAYLGPETPLDALRDAGQRLEAAAVVVAALDPDPLRAAIRGLGRIARDRSLYLGGAGAEPALARRARAGVLAGGPVAGARELAERRYASAAAG